MIDLNQENLVPLREVPERLPPRPNGKRLHISAIYRWMLHGVHGRRLEVIKIGGTTYTSKEALQRFADRLSQPQSAGSTGIVNSATRQRQVDRAAQEVTRILGSSSGNDSGSNPSNR